MTAKIMFFGMLLLVACAPGCNEYHDAINSAHAYPINLLDGKPDTINSEHCGHAEIEAFPKFGLKLDDGRDVFFYFTGGTYPYGVTGKGILCVLVPDYGSEGHAYYLRSFMADKTPKAKP